MMTERLAKLISGVFHPLLLPTYALFILFKMDVYVSYNLTFVGYLVIGGAVFFLSFLIPSLGIFLMKKRGIVKTYQMKDKSERILPLGLLICTYFMIQQLLKSQLVNSIFNYFLLAATMLLIITMLITLFWKISFHMIGIGGIFGTMLALTFIFRVYMPETIFVPLILAGLIGTARLKLKAHTNTQVYAGFLLGSLFMFSLFFALN